MEVDDTNSSEFMVHIYFFLVFSKLPKLAILEYFV